MHLENVFAPFAPAYETVSAALKTFGLNFAAWVHNFTLPEAIFYGLLAVALAYPFTVILRILIGILDSAAEAIMKAIAQTIPVVYRWVKEMAAKTPYPGRGMVAGYFLGLTFLLLYMHDWRLGMLISATQDFILAVIAFALGEIFRRAAKAKGVSISNTIPWRGVRYAYVSVIGFAFCFADTAWRAQTFWENVQWLFFLLCGGVALFVARTSHMHMLKLRETHQQ
jgi:hypothetical protein